MPSLPPFPSPSPTPFSTAGRTSPSPSPSPAPSSPTNRQEDDTTSLDTASFNSVLVGGPELARFDYSPSSPPSSERSLSLSGPTPTPSRPLSLFDSQAPTRVGSPAPSLKEGKEKVVDEEKGLAAPQGVEEEEREGGLRAWLALLGSTLALCCTFGVSNSFGVFLTYYKEVRLFSLPSHASFIH